MIVRGLSIGIILFVFSYQLQARQNTPIQINQISTIKTIDSEEPERFTNPSETGIPVGDINGDGIFDFLQISTIFFDLRDPSSEDTFQSILLSYDDNGQVIKSKLIPSLYMPAGDLDNDGSTELLRVTPENNVEVVSFTESESDFFSESSIELINIGEDDQFEIMESLPGDLNNDGIDDVLVCETEFDAYDQCLFIPGSAQDSGFSYSYVNFSDLGIDFSLPPRLLIDNALAGVGYSFYAIGSANFFSESKLYEFDVNENGDLEIVFDYDWVSTSGEGVYERRYYFRDIDNDNEIEIVSSDNREFPISGFVRIYFNDPICDYREVDYSGDSLVVQQPVVIGTNCVIDRMVEGTSDEVLPKSVNENIYAGYWQEGNYGTCSASDFDNGCSSATYYNDDQTVLPCSYDACKSIYQPAEHVYNGVADPSIAARGLQSYLIGNLTMTPLQRSLIAEIERIAEVACTSLLRLTSGNSFLQTVLPGGFNLVAESFTADDGINWELSSNSFLIGEGASCSGNIDGSNAGSRVNSEGSYQFFLPKLPSACTDVYSCDGDECGEYDEYDEDLEDDFDAKFNPLTSNINGLDTLSNPIQVNLEALGAFDESTQGFTIRNIGNIDGIPGEEMLFGSNNLTSGSQHVNKAWIYSGENSTFDAPDYMIDFNNDSTITGNSFLSLGAVAERLGDVNGDGISDFAVGLPFYDQRFDGESYGAVYVFAGQDMSIQAKTADSVSFAEPLIVLRPNAEPDYTLLTFGSQIAGGDFDGDGFNDIAVLADFGSQNPVSPTIRVYQGGPTMDATPDYFLYATQQDLGGFGSDTVNSFFEAVIDFMPEEVGSDHQDLYFTPGGFSGYPDAVIFTGGISELPKANGKNTPAERPAFTLAEFGPTPTGTGVYLRKKPTKGDFNGDGFYEIVVEKQYDGRDGVVSSRMLVFSPNSGIINSNEEVENPLDYRLSQNYPNPFNPSTTIEFKLGNPGNVSLTVYDLLGREVAVLIDNQMFSSGSQTVQFDASSLASGMYLYRLEAGGFVQTRKMMLIK